jgi:hypothetical protein
VLVLAGSVVLGEGSIAVAADAVGASDAGPGVHGDDAHDRYVGTGGLVLPPAVDSSDRRAAADCPDCQWRLTSPCVTSSAGNAFGGACTSVVRGCPGGELLRPWIQRAGEAWRALDLVCLTQGPVPVAAVGRSVRDEVSAAVPAPHPSTSPSSGVVTQLPVAFAAGQPPGPMHWSSTVLGMSVEVTAHPHWEWQFGDGASMRADEPGGRHPSAVEHTYRTGGTRSVTLRVRWSATYMVGGLGPFTVAEPVIQETAVSVAVGEGRAVLAGPRG